MKRDYGNEYGIPGGIWYIEKTEKHKKLEEFYKTHTWKGMEIGWVKNEDDKLDKE